jgi:hypothetical protein
MGILALSADERVRDVRVSEDTVTVDFWGETFVGPGGTLQQAAVM